MHPNSAFRGTDQDTSLAFARERGFGLLTLNGPVTPLLAHIPFLLAADGLSVDLHLARSNAIARAVPGQAQANLVVIGPDGYISPDWYGVPDMVPTWNYVAVHMTGTLERLPDTVMRDMLVRQSAAFEARLAPKPQWTLDKMSDEAFARMMRMIVPFRLTISDVQSTWKLGQNRTDSARLGAAEGLDEAGFGQETGELARLMRKLPT
jgi:transcriptional regulator